MNHMFNPLDGERAFYGNSDMTSATKKMFKIFKKAGYDLYEGKCYKSGLEKETDDEGRPYTNWCRGATKEIGSIDGETIIVVLRVYDSDKPRAVASAELNYRSNRDMKEEESRDRRTKRLGECGIEIALKLQSEYFPGNYLIAESYDANELLKIIGNFPEKLKEMKIGRENKYSV